MQSLWWLQSRASSPKLRQQLAMAMGTTMVCPISARTQIAIIPFAAASLKLVVTHNGVTCSADQLLREGESDDSLQARDVQLLGSEVQRCQSALKQLPPDLLDSCLASLHNILRGGEDVRIRNWDEVSGPAEMSWFLRNWSVCLMLFLDVAVSKSCLLSERRLQDDSEEAAAVLESLDAGVAALLIMVAEGVPPQVMSEELIMSILTTAKKQLLLNVFANHDPSSTGGHLNSH